MQQKAQVGHEAKRRGGVEYPFRSADDLNFVTSFTNRDAWSTYVFQKSWEELS